MAFFSQFFLFCGYMILRARVVVVGSILEHGVLYLGIICEKVAIFFVLYSFFHIFVAIGKIMNLKCRSCMTAVALRVNPLG